MNYITTFGFQIHLEAQSKIEIEEILVKFMDFIDDNDLDFGGGCGPKSIPYLCGFICYNCDDQTKSCTEQTRTLISDWCSTQPLTKCMIGELISDSDPNYDYDCLEQAHSQ